MRMKLYNADKKLVGSIDKLYVSIKWSNEHHYVNQFDSEEEWSEYKNGHGLLYEFELNQMTLWDEVQ